MFVKKKEQAKVQIIKMRQRVEYSVVDPNPFLCDPEPDYVS